jgi:acetylornithine deacetylase/succinyl-diaminopimelate desuccinylase-like protein
LDVLLHSKVEFVPEYECAKGTFSIEPKLPVGLVLGEDGVISGMVTDDEYYDTNSRHVVTLKNSGGETSTEIIFHFLDPTREFCEFVDANQAEYIGDLANIVSIESVNNGSGCDKADDVFKWLDDFTDKLKNKCETHIDTEDLGSGLRGLYFHPASEDAPTLCVYGHLDVKVPGESAFVLSEDDSPIGPVVDGCGVLNSKGPLVAWLSTANAYCALGRAFPVGLKFVIDTNGLGSTSDALKTQPVEKWLKSVDHVCVAESSWLTQDKPCIVYGLRGAMHFTVNVRGGDKDLHASKSGTLHQVMSDIAAAMNAVSQTDGLEGLVTEADVSYDDITFDMQVYKKDLAIEGKLRQEDKSSCLNAWWAHPAVSVHGVQVSAPPVPATHVCDYKMPSEASFTFSVRTAHGMDSNEVEKLVTKQIAEVLENSTNKNSITLDCKIDPFLGDPSDANYTAACKAVEQVYGNQPDMIRSGGTIAAAAALKVKSKKSVCIFPIGSSMKPLGPESLRKECFTQGIKVYGRYMEALGTNKAPSEAIPTSSKKSSQQFENATWFAKN